MSRHKVKKTIRKRTPRWPLAAALVGVLLIASAFLLTGKGPETDFVAKVKGRPAIEVNQQEYDYGDVRLGSTIKTSVTVTNVGDEPLRFSGRPYVELVEGC